MNHQIEALQRFGLKLFLKPDTGLDPRAFVTVFHRWIQTGAVNGLLIDVADYTHLPTGPSVLLVGHEGNYALDCRGGRPGLYYYRKQRADGLLRDRFAALSRILLSASHKLETDEVLGTPCRFVSNELEFVANDRLLAPATDTTVEALRPALAGFLDTLYDGQSCDITGPGGLRDRLTLTLRAPSEVPIETLLNRLT